MYKIVISGPESTGKTELAAYLAGVFNSPYVPEYARAYVEQLGRAYTLKDVEHIARVQWEQYLEYGRKDMQVLILDTFLIITKIWFREVFDQVPQWIDRSLNESRIDLYLLCYPDLEWKPDPVRENPGRKRLELFHAYRSEIRRTGSSCEVIRGQRAERSSNALEAVYKHLPHLRI